MRQLSWGTALTIVVGCALFTSPGFAQWGPEGLDEDEWTTCTGPVSINSCSYEPEDCWIETQQIFEPWLVRPGHPNSNKNPKNYRGFCSQANDGHWYSYAIVLPPGYDMPENADIRYPVVYWFHGTLKGIDIWPGRGTNLAKEVHKRMKQRKIRPTIYVFPYGGVTISNSGDRYHWIDQWNDGTSDLDLDRPGCDPDNPNLCFRADSAFDELIDHVEANYRIIGRSAARGVQGFSRGGGYAVQRGFRPEVEADGTCGNRYRFTSVVGLSPGLGWEERRGDLFADDWPCGSAATQAVRYANLVPDDNDRWIDLMLKHGDLDGDEVAENTLELHEFLQAGILDDPEIDPGVEPFSHSYEHVVPQCGEYAFYPPPCPPNPTPPVLAHDQPAMLRLRSSEAMKFHQEAFAEGLTNAELDALESHRFECSTNLTGERLPPFREGFNEQYVVGDWDRDGCDTVAVRHEGSMYVDNDFDDRVDEMYTFGPDGARYFGIDWRDSGGDDFGYARWDTSDCRDALEIGLWIYDELLPWEHSFCFQGAESTSEVIVGDFDGDWKDDIGVRVGDTVCWNKQRASQFNGEIDGCVPYGAGNGEDQYMSGRWSAYQDRNTFGVRRDNRLHIDTSFDAQPDVVYGYGRGEEESEYLYGDWDGDGRTNYGVRRCNEMLLDVDFDPTHDFTYFFGFGTPEDDCL